jgi:phosphoenolpyruvate carboxykinase (GTP)
VEDVPWPCNAENKYIVHFPETREIWSFGSGYGGNALLGKKCFALRIASVMARDEGWMAEHMLILKLTSPEGEVKYIAGAFPSACGKTNLAMLIPTLRGLEGRDDRRRHRVDEVRRGRPAVRDQPRGRLLRRRAGDGREDQPQRDQDDRAQLDLHQLREDRRRRHLVGGHDQGAARAPDRLARQRLDARRETPAAHPNARFTTFRPRRPGDRAGVGGPGRRADRRDAVRRARRSTVVPLVHEALDWEHGVFLGSMMSSETTAAAAGTVGEAALRPVRDAAVLRLQHGRLLRPLARDRAPATGAKLPKIFYVNWFRKDEDGRFPVAGLRRELARAGVGVRALRRPRRGDETPIGLIPPVGGEGIDTRGLDVSEEDMAELLRVDVEEWKAQLPQFREHLAKFDRLPPS